MTRTRTRASSSPRLIRFLFAREAGIPGARLSAIARGPTRRSRGRRAGLAARRESARANAERGSPASAGTPAAPQAEVDGDGRRSLAQPLRPRHRASARPSRRSPRAPPRTRRGAGESSTPCGASASDRRAASLTISVRPARRPNSASYSSNPSSENTASSAGGAPPAPTHSSARRTAALVPRQVSGSTSTRSLSFGPLEALPPTNT